MTGNVKTPKNAGARLYKTRLFGRSFQLPVRYLCKGDEKIEQKQKDFVAKLKSTEGYTDIASDGETVKRYVEDHSGEEIPDVFGHIVPRYIMIGREESTYDVAVICSFDADPEHGLAILVRDGEVVMTGPEEIAIKREERREDMLDKKYEDLARELEDENDGEAAFWENGSEAYRILAQKARQCHVTMMELADFVDSISDWEVMEGCEELRGE